MLSPLVIGMFLLDFPQKFEYFANLKVPHSTVNFSSGGHVQKMHFPNVEIRFYSTIQAAAIQPGILVAIVLTFVVLFQRSRY